MSRLWRLQPTFPAIADHTKAGKKGNLFLNALKTSFSYFDKLGSFCLSRLCRLQPIFPAIAAHTKAGKKGNLFLNALKTSFSYFDKLGSFCLSRLCRLQPIFPAMAAHTKAGEIGTLLLNALTTSVSHPEKRQVFMRYLAFLSLKNYPCLFELTSSPKTARAHKCPAFAPGGWKRTGARTRPGPEPPPVPTNTLAQLV